MDSLSPVIRFEISVEDLDTDPADSCQETDSFQICDLCRRYIQHGSAIFMYRDRAYCSLECRSDKIDINKTQEKLESTKKGKKLSATQGVETFGLRRNLHTASFKFLEEGLERLEFVTGTSSSYTAKQRKISSPLSKVRRSHKHSKKLENKKLMKSSSKDLLLHENNQQNQNQSPSLDDHIISFCSNNCSIQDNGQINYQNLLHPEEGSRKMASTVEWVVLLTTLFLEVLAATFDQISSPNKPYYALIGVILSIVALAICVGEIVHKARKEKVIWRRKNRICWLYHPSPRNVPFGSLVDCFGLACAIVQCIFSTVEYAYFVRHANNPIKLSILPIIFATCLVLCRLIKNHDSNSSSTRV